jgi:hypothetical protein
MNVVVEDFGSSPLIAEYDVERGLICVNERVIARVRARYGDEAAEALFTCAVTHERFHIAHPDAKEEAAHAYVRATTGQDPRVLEAMAR